MTTIAYRDGMLAIDNLIQDGGVKRRGVKYCFGPYADFSQQGVVNRRNCLYAWAGVYEVGAMRAQALMESRPWVEAGEGDSALIVVTRSGLVFEYGDNPYPQEVRESYMAWGTGRAFALGAMAMGADAKMAVGVASDLDIYSGCGVSSFCWVETEQTWKSA